MEGRRCWAQVRSSAGSALVAHPSQAAVVSKDGYMQISVNIPGSIIAVLWRAGDMDTVLSRPTCRDCIREYSRSEGEYPVETSMSCAVPL